MKKTSLLWFSLVLFVFLVGCQQISQEATPSPHKVRRSHTTAEINKEDQFEVVEEKKVVSFYAVGDNLIHSPVFEFARTGEQSFDFKPIYKNLAEDVRNADIAYINQETLIGGDERGFSGYPAFNTPSDMIKDLVDLGFDLANGSNNHSLDMGTSGIANTLNYWNEYKDEILYTGVFESQEHRDDIPILERNGITFSVLTYTYGTNGILPSAPYQVNYFDADLIRNDVERAQAISDLVIVIPHWGDEHSLTPNAFQLEYAQLFADLGVDIVLGSHTHSIQPVDWLTGSDGKQTLVIYSLGNLIASSISDINLLGGTVKFNVVEEDNEYSIEDVRFEPIVIHYEAAIPGDIDSRTNFEVIKLKDYTDELADKHALNGYKGNVVNQEHYLRIVEEVIAEEFLE